MTAAEESVQQENHIEPRVEELWARVRDTARGPRPQKIPLGLTEIPIEAWEWDALVAWTTTAAAADVKSWQVLIAEGIALQAKTFDDLDRVAATTGLDDEARGAAFADIDFDALTAFKLLREVQRTIEQMIVKGRIDQAKKLTQFRRRLNDTSAAIGRILGEAALKDIEDLADASPWVPAAHFDPPPPDPSDPASAGGALAVGPEEGDAQARSGKRAETPKLSDEERLRSLVALEDELRQAERHGYPMFAAPSESDLAALGVLEKRTLPVRTALIAILGFMCVGWALFTLRQRATVVKPLTEFALSDFVAHDGITRVVARPPSLYVTVDAESWGRMGLLERQQMIEAIGAKLTQAGYVGAHVTDSEGNSVARWLKDTGVRISEVKHQKAS